MGSFGSSPLGRNQAELVAHTNIPHNDDETQLHMIPEPSIVLQAPSPRPIAKAGPHPATSNPAMHCPTLAS